jgi:hypothetical protein
MLIGRRPDTTGLLTKSDWRTAVRTQTWHMRTCDVRMSVTLPYSRPGSE